MSCAFSESLLEVLTWEVESGAVSDSGDSATEFSKEAKDHLRLVKSWMFTVGGEVEAVSAVMDSSPSACSLRVGSPSANSPTAGIPLADISITTGS
jgi:hypothetical protein